MKASGILHPRGRGSRRKLLAEGFESSYGWLVQGEASARPAPPASPGPIPRLLRLWWSR